MKQLGDKFIPSFGNHFSCYFFNSQIAVKQTRAPYFQTVFKNRYINRIVFTIIPMGKGIDYRFAESFFIYLRDIYSAQSFNTHPDMYIFQNILLRLFNKIKNIAFKFFSVYYKSGVGSGKNGATQFGVGEKILRVFGKQKDSGI